MEPFRTPAIWPGGTMVRRINLEPVTFWYPVRSDETRKNHGPAPERALISWEPNAGQGVATATAPVGFRTSSLRLAHGALA